MAVAVVVGCREFSKGVGCVPGKQARAQANVLHVLCALCLQDKLRSVFMKADHDHDGRLDMEEFVVAMRMLGEELDEHTVRQAGREGGWGRDVGAGAQSVGVDRMSGLCDLQVSSPEALATDDCCTPVPSHPCPPCLARPLTLAGPPPCLRRWS